MNPISSMTLMNCSLEIVKEWSEVQKEGKCINDETLNANYSDLQKYSKDSGLKKKMKAFYMSNLPFPPQKTDYFKENGFLHGLCYSLNKKKHPKLGKEKLDILTKVTEISWMVINYFLETSKSKKS